jgi:hypothetical protein
MKERRERVRRTIRRQIHMMHTGTSHAKDERKRGEIERGKEGRKGGHTEKLIHQTVKRSQIVIA